MERLEWVVASMTCSLSNAFGFFLCFLTSCSVDFLWRKKHSCHSGERQDDEGAARAGAGQRGGGVKAPATREDKGAECG